MEPSVSFGLNLVEILSVTLEQMSASSADDAEPADLTAALVSKNSTLTYLRGSVRTEFQVLETAIPNDFNRSYLTR